MGAAEEEARVEEAEGGDEVNESQARSFKKAWPQGFEADSGARLSHSRFGPLRAFGKARGTVLETQLMQPVPMWVFLVSMTEGTACFGLFFTLAGCCMSPLTRYNLDLLVMLLLMQIVTGIAWWTICYSYKSCLTEPGAGLTLLPRQAVFRGCLVERAPSQGCGSAAGSPAAAARPRGDGIFATVRALIAGRPPPLQDFTVRNHAYTVRLLCQAVIMFVSAGGGVGLQALDASDETLIYARLALHGLNLFVYVETLVSFTFGIHMTICWWIGRKVAAHRARRRGGTSAKPEFVPFDPRATIMQNICFAVTMAPSIIAVCVVYSEEGRHSRCPSIWIASASSAVQMGLVLTTGAAYSFCPFTLLVGLLVAADVVPKPLPNGPVVSDKVLMLTYSIWGPVVSLSDESPSAFPKLRVPSGGSDGAGGGGGGGGGAEAPACVPDGVRVSNFLSVVPC